MKTENSPADGDKENGMGLYIHWPFCQSKCPYCDFNSHVRRSIDEQAWEDALLQELAYVGRQTKGQRLTNVFFGGGTPSLMPAQTVQKLLETLGNYWDLDTDLEVTLEGNPNSVELSKYKDFKAAGINRVSVGIQSLRQDSLTFLGRLHNAIEAKRALEISSTLFDRSSFDLIYALPGQS
ncbi:MAG: radical SAM protein, partial [Alphaproteobacteria bacterium]|nr:radical SAM protein [Alphaproteobacteria bacterium]